MPTQPFNTEDLHRLNEMLDDYADQIANLKKQVESSDVIIESLKTQLKEHREKPNKPATSSRLMDVSIWHFMDSCITAECNVYYNDNDIIVVLYQNEDVLDMIDEQELLRIKSVLF